MIIERIEHASDISTHRFRYYDFLMAATCVVIVCSNIIGAGKVAGIYVGDLTLNFPYVSDVEYLTFGAGILFFPLSYVAGDVLTEVYGYARARRVIWAGFAAAFFAAAMAAFITWIPPAPDWDIDVGGISKQDAFALNFAQAPRIVAASCFAIWAGEITNSFVMAKMKVASGGRHLWQRTIGSTAVGQGVDTILFYPLAFLGVWSADLLLKVMATNYVLKVTWEAILTPVTYRIVSFLKRAEGVDVYDKETDFTPFSTKS